MSTSAQTPDAKSTPPAAPAGASPAVSQPMPFMPGYMMSPGAVYGTPSPVMSPGAVPLSPQLSPLLAPGMVPPGADPVAYQMYLQQMYQMQAAAQMQSYYQQVLAAQQAQISSTLSPTTSPGLGPVGSDAPVMRKRSKRQASSDSAAAGERAETNNATDGSTAPVEGAPAEVAAPPPPARPAPNPIIRDVMQLLIFAVFLLTLFTGRETRTTESYIPFIVLGVIILYKLGSLCLCRRQDGVADAHPDAAVLNQPTHSIVQPPPGLVFDVFAAILHFFLSIIPSWQAPPKVIDDAAEAEAALAAADAHEHTE